MKLISIIDEDFINYKKRSMFIGMPFCSGKCDIDNGTVICQNDPLKDSKLIDISTDDLIKRYLDNDITEAIVFGGREPFDSPFDLTSFIDTLRTRYNCDDDCVIYTGYDKDELLGNAHKDYPGVNYEKLAAAYKQLKNYKNIIIKYGRYIPNSEPVDDPVLGVRLASKNQYAEILS